MLNACGGVYVEQNKFKISCHLDYKQTLSRDSINRVYHILNIFSITTSYRLLCTIFTLYALSQFGMLKLTLTQHCYNSHVKNSASFCGFKQLGWTNNIIL